MAQGIDSYESFGTDRSLGTIFDRLMERPRIVIMKQY